jgi:hypothetical protein
MNSCLNSWGDCGSAYQAPGWSRLGTMKSRAPSGVERVSIGVSMSRKSTAFRYSRIACATAWRSSTLRSIRSRLRSTYR